jgi:DNA-binding transcriptional ArsR family regulator
MAKRETVAKHPKGRDMSPALLEALSHPIRRQVLRLFNSETSELSPIDLRKLIPIGLSNLSYHIRVLNDLNVIRETRAIPIRGSTKHFYESTVTASKIMRSILAKTKDDDQIYIGRDKR